MATTVTLNSVNYTIPAPLDRNWGLSLSNYLIALSTGVLSKAGGTFTLTADADFGPNFGIRSLYFRSRDIAATSGIVRLASSDTIAWRNTANDGNNVLSIDGATEELLYNGSPILALSYGSSNTVLRMNSDGSAFGWGLLTNDHLDAAAAIAYSKLNLASSIVNADVSASAAIAYSKLNLAGSIVNSDISAAAAIVYSKLSLSDSIVNADINASAAIAYSKLSLSDSVVNGDIATGAAIARSKLASGTANHVIINDGSGNLSSEAQLDMTRGGTGASTKQAAFDGLAPGTTKGDLIVHNGTNNVRLPVGSDGQVLTADSGETTGYTWTAPLTNPMTTVGDIIVGGTSGAANRLAIGSSRQALITSSGAPAWASLLSSDIDGRTDGSDQDIGKIGEVLTFEFAGPTATSTSDSITDVHSFNITAGVWLILANYTPYIEWSSTQAASDAATCGILLTNSSNTILAAAPLTRRKITATSTAEVTFVESSLSYVASVSSTTTLKTRILSRSTGSTIGVLADGTFVSGSVASQARVFAVRIA